MKYRKFGRLDWKVSALGFGLMRLPTIDGNSQSDKVDEVESTRMIRHAIDKGVNYLDTAYPYHNGASESVLGKALKDGYREKVRIATKSPVWQVQKKSDFDKYLDEQLKRIDTDYVDFYLFHGLGKKRWEETVLKHDLLESAESAISDGRIKHIGFSFHDDFPAFKMIVDGYDKWEFCQIQYNYMDTDNQAGTKGLKYAASKGLGVVIMEPLLGGRLANPPKQIVDILNESKNKSGPVDLALQWIWDQPEVSLILSGMSTMEQVEGNLVYAGKSSIGKFKKSEHELVNRIKNKYSSMLPIPCTGCGYCMPCPNGVDIPGNFELFNSGYVHEDMRTSRMSYSRFVPEGERASACTHCKSCEEKCPQKINISELMPKVHEELSGPKKK
jgi:predicted aldo/keto reductase-like oxidoreductase